MTTDPIVDQSLAVLREDLATLRLEVQALRLSLGLLRYALIGWAITTLVLVAGVALIAVRR